jgi:hypothetical protein
MSMSVFFNCIGSWTAVVISTRHIGFVYIVMHCNMVCYDTYFVVHTLGYQF